MNVTRQDESPGASWCFLSLFSLFFTTPRHYVSSLDGFEEFFLLKLIGCKRHEVDIWQKNMAMRIKITVTQGPKNHCHP